ncbi:MULTISPECIES: 23S rRNA (cytidine(2498)-2'-O)-methyltransferase RlmM [unclassified Halorhodospira]|uniref:23S rRNA (cytidine(2498)-2'-O)-methyltransferase RlmM n=1 Tax=unclassified Halorhodospira TaxID=2626748 RepID=UPI001EE8C712|nr:MULTISPECIES: 23S rRNA (cytidine(2498)-2'-O)-methyltransferase RlmM [unclassified Halorhodospira]MCG5539647.1 23S rRNA (cytidine(2498)-2'-O)-methyltransferase RlmM [Halorhodospira sp. M39old]MCG5545457.1 23S rRNA (cytidine(2498)-2'-O)-methyltransferase RlmM [Halorhodospira sp. M38]
MELQGWILHCRAGYEQSLASEATAAAREIGVHGYCRAREQSAYVVFHAPAGDAPQQPPPLVFARAAAGLVDELQGLPEGGRAEAIAAALPPATGGASPWLEYPDSDEGRPLARFCRRFAGPLRHALTQAGVTAGDPQQRLRLLFPDSRHCLAAVGPASGWPGGIPRLRMPRSAPSRSVLKLEEALHRLVPEHEQPYPGEHAVDLGAAPGGWTWLLRERGLTVTAIDNGPLAPDLAQDPGVEHRRTDAFRFRTRAEVDWLVCDVVDRPQGITRLMAQWLREARARAAVFNLKLPMRRPLETVRHALEAIRATGARVHAAQLYHDREEITVYARRTASRNRS